MARLTYVPLVHTHYFKLTPQHLIKLREVGWTVECYPTFQRPRYGLLKKAIINTPDAASAIREWEHLTGCSASYRGYALPDKQPRHLNRFRIGARFNERQRAFHQFKYAGRTYSGKRVAKLLTSRNLP